MLKRLPLLALVLILVVWVGRFTINNFLATTLLAYGEDEASRTLAVRYAPNNPAIVAAHGKFLLYRAEPSQPEQALAELTRAAALSPRDYRFALELGRAYENTGQANEAERWMRRAVELAPRYFETRWALGNFLLRAGKQGAFEELQQAARLSSRDPQRPDRRVMLSVFGLMVDSLGDQVLSLHFDLRSLVNLERAYFAEFQATRGNLEWATNMWRTLPLNDPLLISQAEDRKAYRDAGFTLLRELQAKERWNEARQVWSGVQTLAGNNTDAATIVENGGFERQPLGEVWSEVIDQQLGFDWIIKRHADVRVRRSDSEKHAGAYSLQLTFAVSMRSDFQNVSQLLALRPGQTYRLSYFVKTKDVIASAAPFIALTGASQPEAFSVRSEIPAGTNNWREQSLTFTVPASDKPDAGLRLTLRAPQIPTIDLSRVPEIWLDDFKLETVAR